MTEKNKTVKINWNANERKVLKDREGSLSRFRELVNQCEIVKSHLQKKQFLYAALDEADVLLSVPRPSDINEISDLLVVAMRKLQDLIDCGHRYPEHCKCITRDTFGNLTWAINWNAGLRSVEHSRRLFNAIFESAADAELRLGNHSLAKVISLYALRSKRDECKPLEKECRASSLYFSYVLVAYIYAESGDVQKALRIQAESARWRRQFLGHGQDLVVPFKVYILELVQSLESRVIDALSVGSSGEALLVVNTAIDAANYVRGWGIVTRRIRLLKIIALLKLDDFEQVSECLDDGDWFHDDYFWLDLRRQRSRREVVVARIANESIREFDTNFGIQ